MATSSDRNLLFGILALQMDFISREELVAGMQAWVLAKEISLADHLCRTGALRKEHRELLEPLVAAHIQQHGDDPQQSLASISSFEAVRSQLAGLKDEQVEASIANIPVSKKTPGDFDPLATTCTVGANTSEGTRFRILRPHAKGGLGEVFVARDQELGREVALKEIRNDHSHHPDARQRFVREAEITGGLEHPGIVPVYGLGQYKDGRPFYAMRFIRGDSLKEAVDPFHRSSPLITYDSAAFRKLLGRFIDVCNAIEYAHSRGVLHRDLKPGNIMLGKYGETLVVDWGLAKAQGHKPGTPHDGEQTLRPSTGSGSSDTLMGEAVGTPAFMSPEQAAGRLDELGPASDVYSLGATLYYLLVGKAPFTKQVDDLLKRVQRGDFPAPRRLKPEIPQPLEAICLRAMAIRPQDRYVNPHALADDIEHYLADEPLVALPDSFGDRIRRFARRNRTLVRSAAVGLLLVTLVSTVAALLVNEQRRRNAILATDNGKLAVEKGALAENNARLFQSEQIAKKEADAKRIDAELARDEAKQVLEYVVNAFRKPDPEADGERLTVVELLDQATQDLEITFPDQPRLQASLLRATGETYVGLGMSARAIESLERARGLQPPESEEGLLTRNSLALAYCSAGRDEEALKTAEDALADMQKKYGDQHELTHVAKINLAQIYIEAENLPEGIKKMEQLVPLTETTFGKQHRNTLALMNNLAAGYRLARRLDEAISLHQQVFEQIKAKHGAESYPTFVAVINLANAYELQGRYQPAIALLEGNMQWAELKIGAKHPGVLHGVDILADTYLKCGMLEKALPLYERVFIGRKERLGPDHPSTLNSMGDLANALMRAKRGGEGTSLYEEALRRAKEVHGRDHSSTLIIMYNLAYAYKSVGRFEEAISMFREVLKLRSASLGAENPATLRSLKGLSLTYASAGKHDDNLRVCEEFLESLRMQHGDSHVATLEAMHFLAEARRNAKQWEQAISLYEDLVNRRKQVLGLDREATLRSMHDLAFTYHEAKRYGDAVRVYEETLPLRLKVLPKGDPQTLDTMEQLAVAYRSVSQPDKALLMDDKRFLALFENRREQLGDNHRLTIDALSHRGACLIELKRFDEAEHLLIESYKGIQHAQYVPDDWLPTYCDRLMRLYSEWQKPEEAKRWRETRLRLDRKNNLAYHSPSLAFVGSLEAENLNVLKMSGGKTSVQDMAGFNTGRWSKGEQLLWMDGTKAGDRLELEFPVAESGPIDLAIVLTKANDYASIQLYLDDQIVGGPIDLYHGVGVVTTGILSLGNHRLEVGNHRIGIEIVGANPAANKRFMVGVDCLLLGEGAKQTNRLEATAFPLASASYTSHVDQVGKANDGVTQFAFHPHNRWTTYQSPNKTDWLQIEFGHETEFSRVELAIYDESPGSGFHDPKGGSVRTPEKYTIEYLDAEVWKPVVEKSRTPNKPTGGQWNEIKFDKVKSKKMRVVFSHQGVYRSGVSEIAVWP